MSRDLLGEVLVRLGSSARLVGSRNDHGELVIVGDGRWSVLVSEYRDASEHAAVFVARICDEQIAPPDRVLRLAAKMGAGALALIGASYVARFTIPAAQITTAPVERVVMYLHDLATSLEDQLRATSRDVSGLAHLAL